ncbi:bifunctional serine/threonine-protein kinase/formylglycine-generating enzyme family protein [Nodularia sphaerocarpa]|uniref:bifunctional serine/threonine-protein kinase/formylglycine-generating enzyme family protein n=1 Tax=Nodularia sphaerocarpa TaxID=137816 RepID=UPI001EFC1D22|nr:SUMF1/EgtB/PvdO family nonheme iron enzyme [Nodularia sphaerocarpa]ULP73182.1 Serine/threonine-protein kinase B [Nodularia sphaerocarpa UHCC 0038]
MMNIIYCLNPDCLHPNPDNFKYCQKCGSKLVLTERYIPRSILGQGGFGRTFLATDQFKPSQPYCVIKQFLPQAQGTDTIEKASQLFAQEAQRLEELGKHPQIPELMAYFIVDNRQYLVQEFVQGNTLQAELDNNGVFSEKQIRELLLEILEILEFVHSKQVIHRDIKPENIIRCSSNNKLFLVDFGAAKVVKQQQRTATGTIIGSAEYCAPEQSMGKPFFISDLYSLGVTCLHLLTGISPFDLYSPLEGEWVWRDYLNGNVVSDELGKILEKLAHPIAKHRFQSVAEVKQQVERKSSQPPSPPRIQTPPPPPPPPRIQTPPPPPPPPRIQTPPPPPPSIQAQTPSPRSIQTQPFEFDTATITVTNKGFLGTGKSYEINRSRRRAEFFTENLGNRVILDMVKIPGGKFLMGSPENEPQRRDNESPQHRVTIQPFFMGKFPVTQAQWAAVAAFDKVKIDLNPDPSEFKGANRPVEMVSWDHAVEFCARLSQKTGKTYRLPSEAEWEYACRAGTTTAFYFGETITTDLANYDGKNYTYGSAPKGEYRKQTTDVGKFPANPFGLYDMCGNVWEWCQDEWHKNYNNAPADGSAWLSDNDNQPRLLRGGSWDNDHDYCRSALRHDDNPDFALNDIGFRVVCSGAAARTL